MTANANQPGPAPLGGDSQHSSATRSAATTAQTWPPLELVTRPTIPTEQAAYYLARRPQTLRGWACSENGPLRPIRVHGKLAWPVAAIRALLGAV